VILFPRASPTRQDSLVIQPEANHPTRSPQTQVQHLNFFVTKNASPHNERRSSTEWSELDIFAAQFLNLFDQKIGLNLTG
jgi:hypothetical protein